MRGQYPSLFDHKLANFESAQAQLTHDVADGMSNQDPTFPDIELFQLFLDYNGRPNIVVTQNHRYRPVGKLIHRWSVSRDFHRRYHQRPDLVIVDTIVA